MSVLLSVLEIILAYAFTDLLGGIYHYATDKGYNLKSQVVLFQEHHESNSMEGPGFYITIGPAILVFLVGWFLGSVFLLAFGVFTLIAQVPHYYAHVANPPRLVRWLQATGIMISPEHHAKHHNGTFDKNFCVFTGWNDCWLNAIIKFFQPKSR